MWFYLTLIRRRVIGIKLKHLVFSCDHLLLYIGGMINAVAFPGEIFLILFFFPCFFF